MNGGNYMTDVNNVFTAKEVEFKTGMSNQHIRRMIKDGKLDLSDTEVRQTQQGVYLFSDSALEKILDYCSIDHKRKKSE